MELSVVGISKSFNSIGDGETISALKDISFKVPEGRLICIVGPSGCGKTTLLRIISGLDKPDRGRIILDEAEITTPRKEIGYVFQEPGLLPWRTVLRNVEFGLEVAGVHRNQGRLKALLFLELVELKGFEQFYPKEISGGMKQKAALAMSLVMEPKVLLMDEPFVALDSQTRNYLQEVLLRAWEKTGCTVIFVTHNVDEAVFLGDEVICLTSRPAEIGKRLEVDIPRPRERTGSELNSIRREILFFLEDERKKSLHST
ncbi:MAG TPA: nitrate ABC transporter ATP-binding protein [Nitrospiraceae bacterium]|jgi:NitT/TauT family transport system ATP-binding protein|nr:nitrate ABC transporter ATP-binding protein [Nitrospiraceae bacterium]